MNDAFLKKMVLRSFARRMLLASGALGGGAAAILVPLAMSGRVSGADVPAFALGVAIMLSVIAVWAWTAARQRAGEFSRLRISLQELVVAMDYRATSAGDSSRWIDEADAQLKAATRAFRNASVERKYTQTLLNSQEAEQAKFFAKLSHELRTPLNAVLGYSSILLEDLDADPQTRRRDLRRIRDAGQTLLSLIDDLLSQGDTRARPAMHDALPFDLHRMIDLVARKDVGDGSSVTIAPRLRDTQRTVFGNREKVTRLLAGIVEHCSTRAPGGTTHIDVIEPQDERGKLCVAFTAAPIAAGGDQISPESIPQVPDALLKSVEGSIDCVRLSPDTVQYKMTFPIDKRYEVASPVTHPLDSNRIPQRSDDGRRTVLVIDDDAAAIDLLSRWVQRAGYRVVSADNGADGLEIARRIKPDIILLDALMPGRSGYEILPELRQLPGMQCTPILIVTVDDDRARGLESGATDVVRKPVSESQLRSLIAIYDEERSGDVLIIDDDEDAVEILDRTIRRLGFTPRRASNGEEGLAAVRAHAPKAILLDLNMPKLNGFEFIELLSKDEALASIPLIVVSGADLSAPQHSRLIEAGARYYLKGSAAPREIAEGLWEAVA
ncbi:ATP-binding response regulator [Altererythrobacter sp. CAU 1778]